MSSINQYWQCFIFSQSYKYKQTATNIANEHNQTRVNVYD